MGGSAQPIKQSVAGATLVTADGPQPIMARCFENERQPEVSRTRSEATKPFWDSKFQGKGFGVLRVRWRCAFCRWLPPLQGKS